MRSTLAALAAILLVAALADAQEPASSFDQLNTLRAGDIVRVTGKQGRQIRGTVRELSGSSLNVDGEAFAAESVLSIEKRVGRRTGTGIAVGAVIGLGVGVAGYIGCSYSDAHGCGNIVPLTAGIGAGVGAAIGALHPEMLLVYRASAAESRRLSIAPVITARAKGVRMSVAF